jgi:hypothetical protein
LRDEVRCVDLAQPGEAEVKEASLLDRLPKALG